ncbi:MAG: type 1 glutamine amidotransferase [Thermoplasmata archaeon]|nr:MAG: type 1 glutamine amidotransferase [Thermoplasmata archaeon]
MTTLVLDNFINKKYSEYFSKYYQEDLEIFEASKRKFPKDLDKYDHIILSGSEESILNDRKWIEKEMELVREIIDKNIPTLGICFGHQLIARALLGLKGVRKSKTPEIGWKLVCLTKGNPLFKRLEGDFLVFNSHFDEACNLSDDFNILASSEQCNVQAFQIKNAPVWGVQFHPEIDIESGKKYLMDLKKMFPQLKMKLDEAISEVEDSDISQCFFENFYAIK